MVELSFRLQSSMISPRSSIGVRPVQTTDGHELIFLLVPNTSQLFLQSPVSEGSRLHWSSPDLPLSQPWEPRRHSRRRRPLKSASNQR